MPIWLTERPIAHRGLHDDAAGVIENTAAAFQAAMAGGYAIETDLQVSADGEAMVYHDDTLDRLHDGAGALASQQSAALRAMAMKGTANRMMTLGELCDMVDGKAMLLVELKSQRNDDERLPKRTAAVLARYKGPVAVMSFDTFPIRALRDLAPDMARGLVAQAPSAKAAGQTSATRFVLEAMSAHLQFLAYRVRDIDGVLPQTARRLLGMPLLTWTVKTEAEQARARRHADQMIFEGFRA